MTRKILKSAVFAVLAFVVLSVSSCSKADIAIEGKYHFKMSGKMVCIGENDTTESFVLSAQTGTMTIIHDEGTSYVVNMSVMMGGDIMSFNATWKDNALTLDPREIIVSIKPEGESSTGILNTLAGSGSPVCLTFSGSGKLMENTIMMQMYCKGEFAYDDMSYTVVPDSYDIICVADRL